MIRNKAGLTSGLSEMSGIKQKLENCILDSKEEMETMNMVTVAEEILKAALNRKESVGAHYRED